MQRQAVFTYEKAKGIQASENREVRSCREPHLEVQNTSFYFLPVQSFMFICDNTVLKSDPLKYILQYEEVNPRFCFESRWSIARQSFFREYPLVWLQEPGGVYAVW